jgi:hypothetical protein
LDRAGRTVADIFGLDPLGGSKQAHGFGEKVFTDIKR